MAKIGILGGTFDPIHMGHIALAKSAYEQFKLDKVLVMVSNNPPHKKDKQITDINHRVNMIKLAISQYPYMEYSDFELKREGYIYTADTLSLLKEENPNDEYYFIIGGDSLKDLIKWYHPEIVLSKAIILASLREGIDDDKYDDIVDNLKCIYIPLGVKPDIRKLMINAVDISSSKIRNELKIDTNIKEYLDKNVYSYVVLNKLYGVSIDDLRNVLKQELNESRYEHTLGVEYTCAALAMRYEYNIYNARIAGLLHDCAKCIDDDIKLKECIENNIPVTEIENKSKYLLHAKLGAHYARTKYGITDEYILNAIEYHTTGRPNMSLLEKIVFVADYIEPTRDKAKNLSKIRKMAFINLDESIVMILGDTLEYLQKCNAEIDDATKLTYKYYVNNQTKED